MKNVMRRVKSEYDAAVRREELLRKAYKEQARALTWEAQKSVHFDSLKREVEANRKWGVRMDEKEAKSLTQEFKELVAATPASDETLLIVSAIMLQTKLVVEALLEIHSAISVLEPRDFDA